MINVRPSPASSPPAGLLLRTAGGCDLDPQRLIAAFAEQRRRFVAILQGFGADDWAAPMRCTAWSAQEFVRHLSDANAPLQVTGQDHTRSHKIIRVGQATAGAFRGATRGCGRARLSIARRRLPGRLVPRP